MTAIITTRQTIYRAIYDLTRPLFIKQMAWAFIFGAFAVFTIKANMNYLNTRYPSSESARPNDYFFDLIEEFNLTKELEVFIPLSDFIGRLQAVLIILIMWREHFRRVPKLIFLLAAMYMLRGFAIVLTPLQQIHPPTETYDVSNFMAQNFYYGMFFSGHTASAFILVYFVKGNPLRPLITAMAIFQVIALTASRSHYSIDIFGGFFVAYFFTHFDFMCLVPKSLRNIAWMPWYTGAEVEVDKKTKLNRLPI